MGRFTGIPRPPDNAWIGLSLFNRPPRHSPETWPGPGLAVRLRCVCLRVDAGLARSFKPLATLSARLLSYLLRARVRLPVTWGSKVRLSLLFRFSSAPTIIHLRRFSPAISLRLMPICHQDCPGS